MNIGDKLHVLAVEAALPGPALAAVAPCKPGPGPGLASAGATGVEEIESSGQEPSSSTGQSVRERETL